MKHGDKAKSKTASKASGKKSSSKASAKSSSKAPVVVKGKAQQTVSSKTIKQAGGVASGNGKPARRLTPDDIRFSNPLVANAFKRAVKKYPNAFRRLTD